MDYLEWMRGLLANKMQQKLDPNYNAVQASLFNMQNMGKNRLGLYTRPTPVIGSDTKGQSLYPIMKESPRWGELADQGALSDMQLSYNVGHPTTANEMNQLMQKLRQRGMADAWANMMRGGGV